jgi:hypothetical protein
VTTITLAALVLLLLYGWTRERVRVRVLRRLVVAHQAALIGEMERGAKARADYDRVMALNDDLMAHSKRVLGLCRMLASGDAEECKPSVILPPQGGMIA